MQNDVYFTIVYFIDNQLIFKILRYTTAYSSQTRPLRSYAICIGRRRTKVRRFCVSGPRRELYSRKGALMLKKRLSASSAVADCSRTYRDVAAFGGQISSSQQANTFRRRIE